VPPDVTACYDRRSIRSSLPRNWRPLRDREIDRFRPLAEEFDRLMVQGTRLDPALLRRYLGAAARCRARTRRANAQIIARIRLLHNPKPLPILVSSSSGDWNQLDMRILKRVDLLTHSSFTNGERDVGPKGKKLMAYARYVARRDWRVRHREIEVVHLKSHIPLQHRQDHLVSEVCGLNPPP
jgi:methylaspartate ammonia-lyase